MEHGGYGGALRSMVEKQEDDFFETQNILFVLN